MADGVSTEMQIDPVKLRKAAEDIDKVYSSLRSSLYESKSKVDSLKNVWTGSAASDFNTTFQKLLDSCGNGLETLGSMINAVYENADSYERNIKSIEKEAAELPKLTAFEFK